MEDHRDRRNTWSGCHLCYSIAKPFGEDDMILRLGAVKDVQRLQEHLHALGLNIPCDRELIAGPESPLRWPLERDGFKFGNRIAVQPMEGWDGLPDGNPSEYTCAVGNDSGAAAPALFGEAKPSPFPMKAGRIRINW